MTETLKTCPFCGSSAYIERGEVECTNPFCGASVTFSFPGKEREAWNNRTPEETKDEEIKRLREALKIYKEALHEGLWKTGLQDSIWEIIEQAEEKAEQITKGVKE